MPNEDSLQLYVGKTVLFRGLFRGQQLQPNPIAFGHRIISGPRPQIRPACLWPMAVLRLGNSVNRGLNKLAKVEQIYGAMEKSRSVDFAVVLAVIGRILLGNLLPPELLQAQHTQLAEISSYLKPSRQSRRCLIFISLV